jgi:hypothetical protein
MVAMKNLSVTIKLVVSVAVALLVVVTLRTFAQSPKSPRWPPKPGNCKEPSSLPQANAPFVKNIPTHRPLKKMTDEGEAEFAALLCNGHYDAAKGNIIHFKHRNSQWGAHCLPQDCSDVTQLGIKTDNVVVSEAAKDEAELTLIQPHVSIQLATPSSADIKAVMDMLAP